MKADSYFDEVEDCVQIFRQQIIEEEKEIQESTELVVNILDSLFKKDSVSQSQHVEQMKISVPDQSVLNSLYQDEQPTDLFYSLGRESEKKRLLALERKAEYNAYLEKKENVLQSHRKIQRPPVQPKSILDFIDYEKVLARRKEEEARFREINVAELQLQDSLDRTSSKRSQTSPSLQFVKENVLHLNTFNDTKSVSTQTSPPTPIPKQSIKATIHKPNGTTEPPANSFKHLNTPLPSGHLNTPVTVHRTGGGGEPVKDSLGNLITARGYKEQNKQRFHSLTNSNSIDKKLSYREELQQQIEEKRRLDAVAREEARRLEEQLAMKAEEQRQQMLLEYENELKKNNLMKEERQRERLKNLEEFKQKEIAQKQKDAMGRAKQYSKSKTPPEASPRQENGRPPSPPVPSVRSKCILERTTSPAVAKKFTEVKPENLFSSLAEIRKSLMKDKNIVKDSKESYEVTSRRTVNDISDDLDDISK